MRGVFVVLDAYVRHMLLKEERINLENAVNGAFLLGIHMGKKVGRSMILSLVKYL